MFICIDQTIIFWAIFEGDLKRTEFLPEYREDKWKYLSGLDMNNWLLLLILIFEDNW